MKTETGPRDGQGTDDLRERVQRAAEQCLRRDGAVGPLELLQQMLFLHPTHFKGWRQGNPYYTAIEAHIQCGPAKLAKTYSYFHEWVRRRGLTPVETDYLRSTPHGAEPLSITVDGDAERELFFRTRYVSAEVPEKKAKKVREKLDKAPDLTVFELTSPASQCDECGDEIVKGSLLFMERKQPLCLTCADLDHLLFLPRGDAALSRRARKYSPLAAVVLRFSRARKRYERQGLLVTPAALSRAEQECAGDAAERAMRRQRDAGRRLKDDQEFVAALTQAMMERYPSCPADEAHRIASHTAQRGSGRIGGSAGGRAFDPRALDLAVIAWIRHQHTDYDTLLMQGVDRLSARQTIQPEIECVLSHWSASTPISGKRGLL